MNTISHNCKINRLYKSSIIYLDNVDKKTLLIYIGKSKTDRHEKQVKFILDMFVPIDYNLELFWDMHFGIIAVDETMEINEFMIY